MNKDSRLTTEDDRGDIVHSVLHEKNDFIIVTHGTFTICQTGRAFKNALSSSAKTVLLVGAWIPFNEPNSDAEHQMAFALDILKSPQVGVFIAMDNRLWDPDTTEKKEITPDRYQLEIFRF
ncbi:MAG: asparaginase [Alphaproteobacteria bacterium]|nr:asparaginase [Alphaproteobacteria bacterium]